MSGLYNSNSCFNIYLRACEFRRYTHDFFPLSISRGELYTYWDRAIDSSFISKNVFVYYIADRLRQMRHCAETQSSPLRKLSYTASNKICFFSFSFFFF